MGGTSSIQPITVDAVVGLDGAGRITALNLAAEKLLGGEALGMLLAEVLVPSSLKPADSEGLASYLATREARVLGQRIELSAHHRDGTAFPVELSIASVDAGEPHGWTTFIRDISQRKESESLRLLVEAVKDYAIFMLDPEGRVATWNTGAQALKGYAPHEILGRDFSVFYTATDRSQQKPKRELEVASEVGRYEEEGWRVRKDGTEFWANVLITAVRDRAGKLVGFAKVTRDLTEARKSERLELLEAHGRSQRLKEKSQELEEENRRVHEATRLKSEFLANMSHELRTPLNAIIGFAELMFDGKVGPVATDHKEYLGDIINSSRDLLQLINDVLDLAKVESGKMQFRPEPVDVGKVVIDVCDILRGMASNKRIQLEAKVDASIVEAVLDPSKLKQVLYNYVSNALKFTPERGKVIIHVIPEAADSIRIEVEDSGIGIRREDVHRLFVEFQQLDAGSAKRYAGTGLGLALTKRIVEAQGGGVGVRSELGRGSTFWAVLPRRPSAFQVLPASQPIALPTRSAAGKTVLVVDDNPAALRLIGAMLKTIGHSAMCFSDSAEALRAVEKDAPAVVVLDLLMPGLDGYDLINRFRAIPHMRGVPVVVWTVKDLSEDERMRLLLAAQSIVLKGSGESQAILDAVKPYLSESRSGDADVR
jgi:PAS domain S-box-containing protein